MKTKLGYWIGLASVGVLSLNFKDSKASAEDLDSVGGYDAVTGETTTETGGAGGFGGGDSVSGEASNVGGFLKGYNPVTDAQMGQGQYWATPFINFFGNIVGFGTIILVSWIAVQTVIDLIYWGIPPVRGVLAPQNQPAGGMGMGMQQQRPASKLPIFVSDDMLQAMEQGGNVASQGGMNGGMSMGMGMGGMGMGMNGGMGGFGGGMQQEPPKRSHILTAYFKKRLLSVVVLGVCLAVLFSSVLLDTGINLGAFIIKILNMFNDVVISNN